MKLFFSVLLFTILIISVFTLLQYVYHRYRYSKIRIKMTLDPEINPRIYKVSDGPFVNFINGLRKKHKVPKVSLYFSEEDYVKIALFPNGILQRRETPGILPVPFLPSKSIIIFPGKSLRLLDEEDIKWSICHEIGHLKLSTLKIFFLKMRFLFDFQKYLENIEINADAFAAKIMGLEQSIKTLSKFIDVAEPSMLPRRIAKLKEKIPT